MMASLALGMAAANLLGSKSFVLFYALASSVVLCVLSLAWQESAKAKCNVYLFIVEATYIQIPGALDYWYTAEPSCVAQGPNFDMTYYLTYTNMVGAVASIIGIALFQAKMSKWPFRRAFLVFNRFSFCNFILFCSKFSFCNFISILFKKFLFAILF
ncbi:hypothetical protein MHBO_004850 [Bonamia ostreae]|uniref:Uncharacterized protein n=1 Tax=Bonamia ostreae TaxID=126728 RepID=A0ABV2AUF4_9EUKA